MPDSNILSERERGKDIKKRNEKKKNVKIFKTGHEDKRCLNSQIYQALTQPTQSADDNFPSIYTDQYIEIVLNARGVQLDLSLSMHKIARWVKSLAN